MKCLKSSIILAASVAVMFAISGTSFAFHSGSVGECTGCHEMHNAKGINLLQGSDNSSTCLICHGQAGQSSYHVLTPDSQMPAGTAPVNMGPGGDFGWLKKSYLDLSSSASFTEMGWTHGHNVIALDYGLTADVDRPTAPGGTFPSGQLSCTSCHDMHGKGRYLTTGIYSKVGQAIYTSGSYGALPSVAATGNYATGVYRLLRGIGDTVDGVTFLLPPPVAVANGAYNRSEYYTQTRTAYGSGMSDFCAVCHPDFYNTPGVHSHPAGQVMNATIQGNYNAYVMSGNMTGQAATSYLSLVPYEEGLTYSTANINTLKSHAQTDDSQLSGPSAGAQVMCLSCHRAHATGFAHMFRWQSSSNFIIHDGVWPGTDNIGSDIARGHSSQETAAAYYNKNVTKFSGLQRQLCSKCHGGD